MRSVRLSVSGQGIGTSYVHRRADSVNHFVQTSYMWPKRNVPVFMSSVCLALEYSVKYDNEVTHVRNSHSGLY